MIKPILIIGDPKLRKKALPAEKAPYVDEIVENLFHTLNASGGVGLSAPQIGELVQIFVIQYTFGDKSFRRVVINPKVTKFEGSSRMNEGCLSIPGLNLEIVRPESIIVEYINENGNVVAEKLSGLEARIFLHEMDHLRGKLITERTTNNRKKTIRKQVKNLRRKIRRNQVQVNYKIK